MRKYRERRIDYSSTLWLLLIRMDCPLCGPECTCSVSHVPGIIAASSMQTEDDAPRVSTSFSSNSQEPMAPEPYIPDEQERWRSEVASRISNYKARRRRKMEGDFSMKLEFEAPEPQ